MHRLDLLRISLLTALSGCGVGLGDDDGADGNTTTSVGSSADTSGDAAATSDDTTETGVDELCEYGCEGAIELAEGIVQCPDGRINRVGGGTFDPTINAPSCEGNEDYLYCTSDDMCTAGAHGKCISETIEDEGGLSTKCGCTYSCDSDSECTDGQVCVPAGVLPGTRDWSTCQIGTCRANSDCGECGECGLGAYDDGCVWFHAASCRSADDLCGADQACEPGGNCFPDPSGAWSCQYNNCAIGRPLLVDNLACTAPPQSREDWTEATGVFAGLPQDGELAAHWAEIAALEHASVASFAHFGMQLLALGAPAELLRASKRAALDEVEHARLAYGLASAYAGAPLGPGHLDLRKLVTAADWREVVSALIVEACVGETLGVAEVIAAAEQVRVPAVRAVLERIAADELRHAQLAWRSLAWLLGQADARDRAWAQALLERTIAGVGRASFATGGLDRPADGVLGGMRRVQLHRDARARVLAPLARALLV